MIISSFGISGDACYTCVHDSCDVKAIKVNKQVAPCEYPNFCYTVRFETLQQNGSYCYSIIQSVQIIDNRIIVGEWEFSSYERGCTDRGHPDKVVNSTYRYSFLACAGKLCNDKEGKIPLPEIYGWNAKQYTVAPNAAIGTRYVPKPTKRTTTKRTTIKKITTTEAPETEAPETEPTRTVFTTAVPITTKSTTMNIPDTPMRRPNGRYPEPNDPLSRPNGPSQGQSWPPNGQNGPNSQFDERDRYYSQSYSMSVGI